MKTIIVIKRDNSKEAFSLNKIIKVVHAAGLTEKQSRFLAKHISSWIKSIRSKNITTLRIRDRVYKELKTIDPYIANLYNWYQHTK